MRIEKDGANRTLRQQLKVKKSQIPLSGKGLFTKVLIARGTKIVEYLGKMTTWKDADHDDGKNAYIYYVDKNHVIDASKNKKFLARYANDAKGFKQIKAILNNSTYVINENKRVYIKAIKNILPGSEILVGYGKEYWE